MLPGVTVGMWTREEVLSSSALLCGFPVVQPEAEHSTGAKGEMGNTATALAASPGEVTCSGEVSQEQALHSTPNITANPHSITDSVRGCQLRTKLSRKGPFGNVSCSYKRSKWYQIRTPFKLNARFLSLPKLTCNHEWLSEAREEK